MEADKKDPQSSETKDDKAEASQKTHKKIIVGVCAMQRKANSKPMRAIMSKIAEYYKDWLEIYVFPEDVILNEPVENWPLCDCLISFHATDFPLNKAIEYERLRRPYVINDLHRQFDLLDRRKVFRTLARAGIEHPRHCVLVRNEKGKVIGGELREFNDHIEVNGMVFNKPFVEKPISAEDHNVYIYFPSSVGGGSQRLFRKVSDRSSWYSPVSTVRREGSYIYEEFIQADGTDVKVYAVGPYYGHAEARKAPGLDGKVERDQDGKEVRYPVILTAKEKMIARRVVIAFGQTVCGFDLLRANGKSYVCDVNGFSFVKTSTKYYEDTARILGNTILRRLASSLSIPWHIPFQADDPPLVSTPSGRIMELRCVVSVIRHGDRTPKQKMKVVVNDERFHNLFKKYGKEKKMEIKMKKPAQLMEMLELIREILHEQQELRSKSLSQLTELKEDEPEFKEVEAILEKAEENVKTWDQMRTVLEMYGHFSGINRKIQMKYLNPKDVKNSSESEEAAVPSILLIVKWGGELTTAGVLQAEALGKLFRTLYPGIRRTDGKEGPEDTQGLGFLRLHSTYRHDLKIYASDEGRVQMTAAAFTKGLLALEGELTPILMQMVKSANTDGLLNDDYNARQFQNDLKGYLHSVLQADRDFTTEDFQSLNPSGLRSINNAMEFIKNPRKMCLEIAGYVQKMCEIIRWHKINKPDRCLYLNESWELAERRWSKELREFRKNNRNGSDTDFDISKIPDIYDNIKYDLEHNPDLCINSETEFERFYLCVKNMADIVVPQEYGISTESKICVAQRVCTPLLAKIKNDLHRCVQNPEDEGESQTRLDPRASEGIATPMRHVRTRLYFTSESHIHTLMNLIRYGGLCPPDDKKWQRAMNFLSGVTEFNYMTQVVLMVYEDSRAESEGNPTDRFHVELLFSPGLYPCFLTEKEKIYETRFNNKQKIPHSLNTKHSKTYKSCSSDTSDREGNEPEFAKEASVPVLNPSKDSQRSCSFDVPSRSNSLKTPRTSPRRVSPLEKEVPKIPNEKKDSPEAKEDGHESDEELTDNAVNLVVLGEVAGKEFSEMGQPAPPLVRKRHTTSERYETQPKTEELVEEATPENYMSLIYNNAQKLEEAGKNTTSAEGDIPKFVRFNTNPNQIIKSMSDVACNRRRLLSTDDSLDETRLKEAEVNAEGLILEANQATVGSGRGNWAKDIIGSNDEEGDKTLSNSSSTKTSNTSPNEPDRPPLSEVFNRRDIIVMKRSESKEPMGVLNAESQDLKRDGDEEAKRHSSRRSRFPYRFKHHTVNLLTGGSSVDNRLISTDVLMGKFADTNRKRHLNNPAVLSTAVIARSSSAPRLQTYKDGDQIPVAEIRRFWPPLRSLETMHDNIQFKQFDQFLEKMIMNNTPLPSPPRTPVFKDDTPSQAAIDSKLKDTIRRLNKIRPDSVDA